MEGTRTYRGSYFGVADRQRIVKSEGWCNRHVITPLECRREPTAAARTGVGYWLNSLYGQRRRMRPLR